MGPEARWIKGARPLLALARATDGPDGENKRGGPKTTASQDRSCDKHEADYWIFSQIRSLASPGTNRPSAPVASSFGSAPPTISRRIFSISATLSSSVTVAILPTCPPNSTASDASTPNFSFNHLILFSRYSCAWGNLPGTIRALRTKVTDIGSPSYCVFSTRHKFIVLWEAH